MRLRNLSDFVHQCKGEIVLLTQLLPKLWRAPALKRSDGVVDPGQCYTAETSALVTMAGSVAASCNGASTVSAGRLDEEAAMAWQLNVCAPKRTDLEMPKLLLAEAAVLAVGSSNRQKTA